MPLRLKLIEDQELLLEVDPDAWSKAFEQALRNDEVVQVKNPRGELLAINPRQVLYWTTVSEGSEDAPSQGEPVVAGVS
jgi:hypothetical protein